MSTHPHSISRLVSRSCALLVLAAGLALPGGLAGCATHRSGHDAVATAAGAPAVEALLTEARLADALDHQALYTLAGGLKPMSSGFWTARLAVDQANLGEVERVRSALAPLRNDLWYADVQAFAAIRDGERTFHAYVVHREALARMITAHGAFWSAHGISPTTHPAEVIAIVDRLPRGERWRGYGYLFGYPADAVDFFVAAGLAANESGSETGPGIDRQFVHIPTFAAPTGRFTYAVPLDHEETAADRALAEAARSILSSYTRNRDRVLDPRHLLRELRSLNAQHRAESARAARVRDGSSAAGREQVQELEEVGAAEHAIGRAGAGGA